jgi:hypothetical protein
MSNLILIKDNDNNVGIGSNMINDIKGNINITQNLNVSGNVNINNNLSISQGLRCMGNQDAGIEVKDNGHIISNGMLIFKGENNITKTHVTQPPGTPDVDTYSGREPWVNRSQHSLQIEGTQTQWVRNYIRMQTPKNIQATEYYTIRDWYIGTMHEPSYCKLVFSSGEFQATTGNEDKIRYCGFIMSSFGSTSTFVGNNANGGAYNSGDQMNFTGQHRCVPQNIDFYNNIDNYIGLIVYATGDYKTYSNSQEKLTTDKEAITINDSLPIIDLSNKKKQKSVFGIISNKEEEERTFRAGVFCTPYPNINDDKRLYINSVGEGAIWIVNTNGNLENGDYIQASDVIGMGEKQDDDILHNYTVAKITCDCNFDTNSTKYNCVEFVDPTSGNTYKKAFVGCSYHCG